MRLPGAWGNATSYHQLSSAVHGKEQLKSGAQGLGYYRDAIPNGCSGVGLSDVRSDAVRSRPVVITLADLLCIRVDEERPGNLRQRAKRVRTRRRGQREVECEWSGPHAETVAACALFRKAGLWAFDTFNPNCGRRALDYLDATTADACFFQEMKCRAEDLDQQARTQLVKGGGSLGGRPESPQRMASVLGWPLLYAGTWAWRSR